MAISVNVGIPAGKDPMLDAVYRAQMAAKQRQDKSDEYKLVSVEIEAGTKNAQGRRPRVKVNLKYALDGCFLFAVFRDNASFHDLDREEWEAAAKNALERYAAVNGLQIKSGPRPEDGNRYNFMIEATKPIEWRPETLEFFRKQRAEREEVEAALAEADRLRRLLGVNQGMQA